MVVATGPQKCHFSNSKTNISESDPQKCHFCTGFTIALKAGELLLWSFVYKTFNFLIQLDLSALQISQMLCFVYFGHRHAS